MDQSESQMAKSCQALRGSPGSEARTVLSKGNIAGGMRGVLNAPMPPDKLSEATR
jgi:hypothetical protein